MRILILDDDQSRMVEFSKGIIRLQNKGHGVDAHYTYNQNDAISKLKEINNFDYIFLDHDLGFNGKTGVQCKYDEDNNGYNVAKWIVDNNYKKDNVSIIIHSWNIPASTRMYKLLFESGYPVVQYPGAWNLIGV